ncbi:hypothetical protein SAMN05660461_0930 [Chitinophaga ginsengisegetis]|uniref:Uncharacterized protein n=1 Tax=Chitinophaga ginsengisegetis TaxID=393003 RepID=A0A1T5NAL5_9BACT|nr:hypothetical protein SAMN05660461_0930 [Chitinophaga ginsengisegetis]
MQGCNNHTQQWPPHIVDPRWKIVNPIKQRKIFADVFILIKLEGRRIRLLLINP